MKVFIVLGTIFIWYLPFHFSILEYTIAVFLLFICSASKLLIRSTTAIFTAKNSLITEIDNSSCNSQEIDSIHYTQRNGARTRDGYPVFTFPDTRNPIEHNELQLLVTYLLQVPPLEEAHKGYVIVIDRRMDKWSAVRSLLSQLMSCFPGPVRVVFLLKPEGVLQRALEVGYRNVTENFRYKVVVCQNSLELRHYVGAEALTMDVGGVLKYNHLEWVQHRMDVERMKSSAAVIAQSLSDFGRSLKETELPNDVETTARLIEVQTAEREAIKEDFRISIRKGMALLRQVRQHDVKPEHEQLSPTRLQNVTAIERMLIQLEETEHSFDVFWSRHEEKLRQCLQLRTFEESFRKLQSSFAKHMLYLEEHREIGDSAEKVDKLTEAFEEYSGNAIADVDAARCLRSTGQDLISSHEVELSASLLPKCDELTRMADALESAVGRRREILRLSKAMHQQIKQASEWCKRGVDLLCVVPVDLTSTAATTTALSSVEKFIAEGDNLRLDVLNESMSMNNLILLTTTETSTLLTQVAERINDIKRLSTARRDALQKLTQTEDSDRHSMVVDSAHKAEVYTPTVTPTKHSSKSKNSPTIRVNSSIFPDSNDMNMAANQSESSALTKYVIDELVSTEQVYVRELTSIVDFYIRPFDAPENQSHIPATIRGRSATIFGNISEILEFHDEHLLKDFLKASDSVIEICQCFIKYRTGFFDLYNAYCQNKPASEALRGDNLEAEEFFSACQKRAGHPLPLGAYLLKPIQRITKYQLLLKELQKHCSDDVRHYVDASLSAMLYLLSQLNSAMQQLHISGYAGDLKSLGSLRIQSECDIYAFKKRNRRISKAQRRHLFLFDGGLLFCKKRTQPVAYAPEYYEHKINIPTSSLGFTEISTTSPSRFDVWDEKKNEAYAVKPMDDDGKSKWLESLQRLSIQGDRLTAERAQHRVQRPQSWTSTISNESSTSRQSSSGDTVNSVDCNFVDTNGNQSVLSLTSPTSNTTSCKVLSPSNGDKCITKTTNIIYSSPKSSIDSGVTRFILETFDIPKEQTTAANVVDYSSANHDFVSTVETFDC